MPEEEHKDAVPEGYPPMSRPVKPAERLPDEIVKLERCTVDDIEDIVNGSHVAVLDSSVPGQDSVYCVW